MDTDKSTREGDSLDKEPLPLALPLLVQSPPASNTITNSSIVDHAGDANSTVELCQRVQMPSPAEHVVEAKVSNLAPTEMQATAPHKKQNVAFKMPMMVGPRPGFSKHSKTFEPAAESISRSEITQKSATPHLTAQGIPEEDNSETANISENSESSNAEDIDKSKYNNITNHSSVKSPVTRLEEKVAQIPYKEPSWGGISLHEYKFEVLRNGSIISTVDLDNKSFYVFGRLESCDIVMEHPSLSRYHAVVQYRSSTSGGHNKGFYLFDLNSTHGTYLNKEKIRPKTYYRIHVGHIIKFAGSTRLYLLQGPDEDQEEESELSVTELKMLRKQEEAELQKELDESDGKDTGEGESQQEEEESQQSGINWGMGEDAVEEDPLAENPFALEVFSQKEYRDPKKTLRGFFEREGLELVYDVTEKGPSHNKQYNCRVKLPIEGNQGEPLYAEASIIGKKKEAVLQCALSACRILDANNLLRQASHESHKRKLKSLHDEDYYSSDDDNFLDRTGTVEQKRVQRLKRAGKEEKAVETYDSLLEMLKTVETCIAENEAILKQASTEVQDTGEVDPLDAFMNNIRATGGFGAKERMEMKKQIFELRNEEKRLQHLINIAKPASLPALKPVVPTATGASASREGNDDVSTHTGGHVPVVGHMKGYHTHGDGKSKPKGSQIFQEHQPLSESQEGVEEEEEDESDERPEKNGKSDKKTLINKKSGDENKITVKPLPTTKLKGPQLPPHLLDKVRKFATTPQPVSSSNLPGDHDIIEPIIAPIMKCEGDEIVKNEQNEREVLPKDESIENLTSSNDALECNTEVLHERTKPEESTAVSVSQQPKDVTPSVMEVTEDTTLLEVGDHDEEDKRATKRRQHQQNRRKRKKQESDSGYDPLDPNYAVWVPPADQSGDGKTALNDRFGY